MFFRFLFLHVIPLCALYFIHELESKEQKQDANTEMVDTEMGLKAVLSDRSLVAAAHHSGIVYQNVKSLLICAKHIHYIHDIALRRAIQ